MPSYNPDDLGNLPDSIKDYLAAQGASLDDMVVNDSFGTPKKQPRGSKQGVISGKGDKQDLQYSALESIFSQGLSRIFGSSFYPVVTGMRIARTAAKETLGEDVGFTDMLGFVAESTSDVLDDLLNPFSKSADKATDTFENFNQVASEASDVIGDLGKNIDDLAVNDSFPGDPGGDDGDGDESEAMNQLKQIAGTAGAAVSFAFLAKVATDFLSQSMQGILEQVKFLGEATVSSIRPDDQSAIGFAAQPVKAGASAGRATSGIFGTMLGAKFGEQAIGGYIKKLAPGVSDKAAGFAGKAAGSVGGFLVLTAVMEGVKAGVSTVAGLLTSIDQTINQLANDLAPFNPELMGATVTRQLDLLEDDFRRSEKLGAILADNVSTRTAFNLELRRFGDRLVETAGPAMNEITEAVANVLFLLGSFLDNFEGGVIGNAIVGSFKSQVQSLKQINDGVSAMREYIRAQENHKRMEQIDMFLNPATNGFDAQAIDGANPFGSFLGPDEGFSL